MLGAEQESSGSAKTTGSSSEDDWSPKEAGRQGSGGYAAAEVPHRGLAHVLLLLPVEHAARDPRVVKKIDF